MTIQGRLAAKVACHVPVPRILAVLFSAITVSHCMIQKYFIQPTLQTSELQGLGRFSLAHCATPGLCVAFYAQ